MVRVLKYPAGKKTEKNSLAVIAKPEQTAFTVKNSKGIRFAGQRSYNDKTGSLHGEDQFFQ